MAKMHTTFKAGAVLGIVGLLGAVAARPSVAALPTLHGTGIASNGSQVADQGAVNTATTGWSLNYDITETDSSDPNYGPGTYAYSGETYVLGNSEWPIQDGFYTPGTSASQWITEPLAFRQVGDSAPASTTQPYSFTETFNLSGYTTNELKTFTLSGDWAVDNYGSIELNGTTVTGSDGAGVISYSPNSVNSESLNDFKITGGLKDGTNTLTFLVYNAPSYGYNPVALDAGNLALAVPEASSVVSFGLLLMLGIGGMVFSRRRQTAA
jgi:hypothetical protein